MAAAGGSASSSVDEQRLGRDPFKVEIAGSNPAGVTTVISGTSEFRHAGWPRARPNRWTWHEPRLSRSLVHKAFARSSGEAREPAANTSEIQDKDTGR